MRAGPQGHGWREAYSLPPSLSHHRQPGIDSASLAGLADWRHKQRQLGAAKAMQPEPTMGSVLDEEVEVVGAEEENLPPVLHKAWEASRVGALNEVLGVELHPEELLLEA